MPTKNQRTKKERSATNLAEVADIYAVNLDTVKRWRADGMPGKAGAYVLHDVSKWLRSEGPWKGNAKPTVSTDDPLLETGDSPALERYRLAKAKHAELDLEHRKGELIERAKCRDVLARWAVVIRRMGEKLSKRHGPDASSTVNETLQECESIVVGVLSGD